MAINGSLVISGKINQESPCFRELDRNPEYEAGEARMIRHLKDERQKLALPPIKASI